MLIKNMFKNLKTLEKRKIMILGDTLHHYKTKKTKIDVIPRSCFNINANLMPTAYLA